jgi:16S rRNA (guanine(966)-N(2))-methyltransferase RsmD
MDRMRESVFAVLGDLTGRSFLDLFSGSGVIGLEALSRGAFPVELVEKDRQKRAVLLENAALAEEGTGRRAVCRFSPAELFIARCKRRFDVIFCDPPFPYRFRREMLQAIADRPLLSGAGLLLIHRPREDPLPPGAGPLVKTGSREYGRSIVDFYARRRDCAASGPAAPVKS